MSLWLCGFVVPFALVSTFGFVHERVSHIKTARRGRPLVVRLAKFIAIPITVAQARPLSPVLVSIYLWRGSIKPEPLLFRLRCLHCAGAGLLVKAYPASAA